MLLVTGATGAIGRPLIDILINEGAKVRAVTHGPQAANLMARYARGVGQIAPVTGEVERVLGRPARTYGRWVADHAAAFRHQQPAGSNR